MKIVILDRLTLGEDLDITKAITDMKMLDYAHQATLSNAGKMFNNTLLNYMR